MFHNRQEAALQLAEKLKGRKLRHPLVLAIPRGGVITGAILAQKLGAELDVVLSRKLHAPGQPELALGAVSEDGNIYLSRYAQEYPDLTEEYLSEERRQQLAEIERRKKIFHDVRPPAPIRGRSVIVTDDGIATGSTMIAALQATRLQNPHEIIVAVPIVSPERIPEISRWCDDLVYLQAPEEFWAIGQFYEDFEQIPDDEVSALLRQVNVLKGSDGKSRGGNHQQVRPIHAKPSEGPVHRSVNPR
jgi:predicted phosphoribosyltransferase